MGENTKNGLTIEKQHHAWRVYHAASGLDVVGGLRLRRFAEEARDDFLSLDIDWTEDKASVSLQGEAWHETYRTWYNRARQTDLDPVTFEYYSWTSSYGQEIPSAARAAEYREAARLAAEEVDRPGDEIVLPGQHWYHFYDGQPRDDFGRRRWHSYWHDKSLPERGGSGTTRGQVFHADDREHMRKDLSEGTRVFLWPSREEVTVAALDVAQAEEDAAALAAACPRCHSAPGTACYHGARRQEHPHPERVTAAWK
jgi:cytochrome c553